MTPTDRPERAMIRFERTGYGRHIWIANRIRLSSAGTLTPMRPHVYRSGDEFCNDVLAVHAWPLFGVDVWWRKYQRTETDGLCATCLASLAESFGVQPSREGQ